MKRLTVYFSIIIMFACSTSERQTFAHITERRMKAGGKLLISYQFREGNNMISDSIEVTNRVVPHDSVKVAFSAAHPVSSHLLLP
jgi:hypothetical protein